MVQRKRPPNKISVGRRKKPAQGQEPKPFDPYRLLAEHAHDAMFVLQDERIIYHNPQAVELSGYTAEELRSMRFLDLIHPDDRFLISDFSPERPEGVEVPENAILRAVRKNGDIVQVRFNADRVVWYDEPALLCTVRDSTHQHQAETRLRETRRRLESKLEQHRRELMKASTALQETEIKHEEAVAALRRTERIYRVLFNSARDGVLVLDDRGKICDVSKGAERLYGYRAGEMVGKNFSDFLAAGSKPAVGKSMEELRKLQSIDDEIQVIRRDGSLVDIWCRCSPFTDAGGNFDGVLVYDRNISRTKRLREQLIRSERLAATGQLAASVAHEINSPLQGIIGLIGVLKKSHAGDVKLVKNLDLLEGAFDSIRRTVRNLLDLNRPGKQLLQRIDINRIIENTLVLVQSNLKKNKVNIKQDLADKLPNIIGSPQQISQLIMNLINNAVEAMNGVSLTEPWDGRDTPGGEIRFATYLKNEQVVLEVADSGPGISTEDLQHIFDPFYTSKKKMGMGVGLTVCYGIVAEHQGAIAAENVPHGGAVFRIELPVPKSGERKRPVLS
jgi:PAS domain S-box-containing protein